MPPHSRGHRRIGSHSHSTPNLQASSGITTPQDTETDDPPFSASPDRSDFPSPRKDTASSPRQRAFSKAGPARFTTGVSEDDDGEDDEAEESHDSDCVPTSLQTTARGDIRKRPAEARRSNTQPVLQRPFYTHASRSQSYLSTSPPVSFAPPFYNRPPLPLPPSPSLTSLLRPPFSAHPSRPTTPDSSDTEAAGIASADAGQLAKNANGPVPRASPKVPTYEYYGFVLYLGSSLAFLMYLLWSFLPTPFLHQLGIYYYPNRWWSLAMPAWLTMLVVYIYVALASYNTGILTLPMNSLENFVDEKGEVAVIDMNGKIIRRDKSSRFRSQDRVRDQRSKSRPGNGAARSSSHTNLRAANANNHKTAQRSSGQPTGVRIPLGADFDWRNVWNEGTDAVLDVPIGGACEILYGEQRDRDFDEDLSSGDDVPLWMYPNQRKARRKTAATHQGGSRAATRSTKTRDNPLAETSPLSPVSPLNLDQQHNHL